MNARDQRPAAGLDDRLDHEDTSNPDDAPVIALPPPVDDTSVIWRNPPVPHSDPIDPTPGDI